MKTSRAGFLKLAVAALAAPLAMGKITRDIPEPVAPEPLRPVEAATESVESTADNVSFDEYKSFLKVKSIRQRSGFREFQHEESWTPRRRR